jgi:hypothetical protein
MNLFSHQEPVGVDRVEIIGTYPDPALATLFALSGISLGQFYNGCPLRGLVWGAGGIAVLLLIRENILPASAGILVLAACATDTYFTAHEIRNGTIPFRGISGLFWVEVMLAVALGSALGITTITQILSSSGTIL